MMRRTINLLLMLLFVAEVTFLITDFGAKTDDEANPCHEAINQAILQCSLSGGGTVIVPKGTFYTGPITLKSNVNFHLVEGSVL